MSHQLLSFKSKSSLHIKGASSKTLFDFMVKHKSPKSNLLNEKELKENVEHRLCVWLYTVDRLRHYPS